VPKRKDSKDRRNRLEQYGDGHFYTHLPPIDGVEWLASAWSECGRCLPSFNGPVSLTWQEIESYDRSTGFTLGIYGRSIIRQMSNAYVAWINRGGQQESLPEEVPYIHRSESAAKKAAEYMIKNRDSAYDKQQELS